MTNQPTPRPLPQPGPPPVPKAADVIWGRGLVEVTAAFCAEDGHVWWLS